MEFMRQRQAPTTSTPQAPGMLSLIETVKDYIECMLGELQGRKALIMDKETLSKSDFMVYVVKEIVSLVYSRT